MDKVHDDEIDILSLFQTIWEGKWKILSIMAISLLSVFGFNIIKPNTTFNAQTEIKPITSFELDKYNREVKYCGYCLRAGQATHAELENKLRPGSLILDIIDPKSQRSVWRSVYPLKFKADDNSREMQEKISTAVDSMLRDFPQGKRGKASASSSKEPA